MKKSFFISLLFILTFNIFGQDISEFINSEGNLSYKVQFDSFENVELMNFENSKIKKSKSIKIENQKDKRFPSVLNEKEKSVFDFENVVSNSYIFHNNKNAFVVMKKNGNENRLFLIDSVKGVLYNLGDIRNINYFYSDKNQIFVFIKDHFLYVCDFSESINFYKTNIILPEKVKNQFQHEITLFRMICKDECLYSYEKDESGITAELFIPYDFLKENIFVNLYPVRLSDND